MKYAGRIQQHTAGAVLVQLDGRQCTQEKKATTKIYTKKIPHAAYLVFLIS